MLFRLSVPILLAMVYATRMKTVLFYSGVLLNGVPFRKLADVFMIYVESERVS